MGYGAVFRHPAFIRMAPLAVFVYGGLLAMQSLWIGPWLTRVVGQSASEAAAAIVERLTDTAPASKDVADAVGNVLKR